MTNDNLYDNIRIRLLHIWISNTYKNLAMAKFQLSL